MLNGATFLSEQNKEFLASEASKAYEIIALQPGMITRNMHSRPYCNQFTQAAIPIVREACSNIDSRVMKREWRLSGVRDFIETRGLFFHNFISVEFQKDELVIDGTWQQFVPKRQRHDELPLVLVGTRDEVVEYAGTSGVPQRFHRVWQ